MGRKHLLDTHQHEIVAFLNDLAFKAYTEHRLKDILQRQRYNWDLSYKQGGKYIIDYLKKKELLFTNVFYDKADKHKEIYSWGTQEDFTVISGLKADSFFSYYSALYLHSLTNQIPKIHYLNVEHTSDAYGYSDGPFITQDAIDRVFAKAQRQSSTIYTFQDKKIILTNSKRTEQMGVITVENEQQYFQYTDIERTLIDCVVRPAYAGGVFEVLQAFILAKEQLDFRKLAMYLQEIDYIYPYHQVIGLYLERAGYDEDTLKLFDTEKEFNFYLTYQIRDKDFSERWKLYYPRGF